MWGGVSKTVSVFVLHPRFTLNFHHHLRLLTETLYHLQRLEGTQTTLQIYPFVHTRCKHGQKPVNAFKGCRIGIDKRGPIFFLRRGSGEEYVSYIYQLSFVKRSV